MNRYYAEKSGITRVYRVVDRTTGKSVDRAGTYPAAARKAAKLNAALS